MSLNTDIFYQHLSATINIVWLYYQHPIKTTPCRNPATTSQTTPIILAINFQYNSTPTTSHISTNPQIYNTNALPTYPSYTQQTSRTLSTTKPKYTLPQRLVGTKESVCRKKFNSHQYGRRDVSWKRSLTFWKTINKSSSRFVKIGTSRVSQRHFWGRTW